jgi:membrane fusion protein, multidrug efflux system
MQTRVERNERKPSTTKRMIVMVVVVLLLIAAIAGIKFAMVMRMMAGMKPPPPSVVSTAKATYENWQPAFNAVGTLRAVRGADLALDIAGLVTKVNLKSGDEVKEGEVLLQLRDSEDVAQLHQLEASTALAGVTFERAKQQLAAQASSKADYDAAAADLKAKQAAVQQQQVNVAKKQLRAPFSGRAGIITVNPGAYLNSGTTIVTVQEIDPVFIDFHLPQRNLADLKVGQKIKVKLDAFKGKTFEGKITAISPKIDNDTRNVQVEASVPNPDRLLTPGMFADVNIDVGSEERHLTLPQTAVVYNPYGETVYLVKTKAEFDKAQAQSNAANAAANGDPKKADAKADPKNADAKDAKKDDKKDAKNAVPADQLVAQQTFVTTGTTRGDQVAIVSGLDDGAEVVTSGQVKLKSGSPITIDNSVQPANSPNPTPQEH